MAAPEYHILICNSYRLTGSPQGVCNKKDAATLPQFLEEEIIDRGIDAMVSTTSCFKMCREGPVMVVYPQGWWYHEVNEDKIDEILDALEDGEPAEALLASA